jgi:hypothetical protein
MRIYEIESNGEIFEYVEIQLGENHFTSMLKSTYDEMQAEQSTPSL